MCTGVKKTVDSSGRTTVPVTIFGTNNQATSQPPKASGKTEESTLDTPAISSNPLTIGTKKYRNNSGLGSSLAIGGSPTGIPLAK